MATVTITIKDGPLDAIDTSVVFEPPLTKDQIAGDEDLTDAQGAAAHLLEELMNMGEVQNLDMS